MDYEKKLKPISGQPASYQSKLKPVAPAKAVASEKGLLGDIAAGTVKPFARLTTNLINAGQIALGRKETNPLSGKFLGEVERVGNTGKGFLADVKDAVGAGAEVASNIPIFKGAGLTYDVLRGATKASGRSILKKAVVPLIKEGAVAGGLMRGGEALQKDKKVGGVLLDAGIGALGGATLAPIFAGAGALAGKGLGKVFNTDKIFKGSESKFALDAARRNVDDVADYVRAPLTAAEKGKLRAEKRGTEYGGLFKMGQKKFKLGDEDYLMAEAVKDLVDPRMSQSDANIDRILKDVTRQRNQEIIPFLKENPVPYQWDDLTRYIDTKMKPSTLLKNNREAFRNFQDMKKRGLEIISQFSRDQEGIQNARIAIDNMIDKEFGEAIWNKAHPLNSQVKEAALKLRTTLNDFTHDSIKFQDIATLNKVESFLKELKKRGIATDNLSLVKDELLKYFGSPVLPENELKAIIFRQQLKNMNLKLKAADNIWMNSAKEVGKSLFKNLTKDPLVGSAALLGTGWALSRIFKGAGIGSASGNNSN